jgi:hypothetical protein
MLVWRGYGQDDAAFPGSEMLTRVLKDGLVSLAWLPQVNPSIRCGQGAECRASLEDLQARAAAELVKQRRYVLQAAGRRHFTPRAEDFAAGRGSVGNGSDRPGAGGGGAVGTRGGHWYGGGRAPGAYSQGEVAALLAHLQRRGLVELPAAGGSGGGSGSGGSGGGAEPKKRRSSLTKILGQGMSLDGPSHPAQRSTPAKPKGRTAGRSGRSPSAAQKDVAGKYMAATAAAASGGDVQGRI